MYITADWFFPCFSCIFLRTKMTNNLQDFVVENLMHVGIDMNTIMAVDPFIDPDSNDQFTDAMNAISFTAASAPMNIDYNDNNINDINDINIIDYNNSDINNANIRPITFDDNNIFDIKTESKYDNISDNETKMIDFDHQLTLAKQQLKKSQKKLKNIKKGIKKDQHNNDIIFDELQSIHDHFTKIAQKYLCILYHVY